MKTCNLITNWFHRGARSERLNPNYGTSICHPRDGRHDNINEDVQFSNKLAPSWSSIWTTKPQLCTCSQRPSWVIHLPPAGSERINPKLCTYIIPSDARFHDNQFESSICPPQDKNLYNPIRPFRNASKLVMMRSLIRLCIISLVFLLVQVFARVCLFWCC